MSPEGHWQGFLAGTSEEGAAKRHTAVLICGTEEFCAEARRELQRKIPELSVVAVQELDAARRLAERESLRAILAEDRAVPGDAPSLRQQRQAIAAALLLLAVVAPVVWIGSEEEGAAVARLVPPGTAELVPRSALSLPAAVSMVQRHLRLARAGLPRPAPDPPPHRTSASLADLRLDGRDFGEVLRHELNNPLTGILGNAELLLLAVRRGTIDLPPHDLRRLEIIADLAVRMRETVRQLSDRWLAAGGNLAGEKQTPAEEPRWPLSG